MKKPSALQIVLELIVILGSLIIGTTILVCHFLESPISRTLIGLIIIAIGAIGVIEYLTLKIEIKLKSVQSLITYLLTIALGIILLFIDVSGETVCIIWGIFTIIFALVRIVSSFMHILKQPLLHIVRLISQTTAVVFAIILIVKTISFAHTFFIFTGILLLIEGVVLLIEFIIHRFQN